MSYIANLAGQERHETSLYRGEGSKKCPPAGNRSNDRIAPSPIPSPPSGARGFGSDEDLVGERFAVGALQREFRAFLVLVDERLEQAERVADDFGIRGRLRALLQLLQTLHRLGRHFQLHARGGALTPFAARAI